MRMLRFHLSLPLLFGPRNFHIGVRATPPDGYVAKCSWSPNA